METRYVNMKIRAGRLEGALREQASGEANCAVERMPACSPAGKQGKVLDLQDYRRRLAEREKRERPMEEVRASNRSARGERLVLFLDLTATAAVVAAAAGILTAFLGA